MIPMVMHISISETGKRKFRLFIPLILVWILLFPLLVILLPFLLIAALLAWPSGYGRVLLATIPMLFSVIGSLSGLRIHVEDGDKKVHVMIQ
jgi:hypothetical protein